jgi:succinate dehydrogenase / fumarate reductase cytochrome b subunit
MAFGKRIGLKGFTYAGGGPMLAWLLHRIGGLVMVVFIGLHVLASFSMQQFGSEWGTAINTIYESWPFQMALYFFVLFHALNGVRIIILDFAPQFLKYQREATWVQWILLLPLWTMTVLISVLRALQGG